eukprot:6423760-Prymnesium_polylepis.1
MKRGEKQRPAAVHLLCHGLAGPGGAPTTKFDLGEHVTWAELMQLFANPTDYWRGGDGRPANALLCQRVQELAASGLADGKEQGRSVVEHPRVEHR